MIVVDTNILAYLWIPGDGTADAEALLRVDEEWCAPILWRSELRNVMLGYVRRRAMTLATALKALAGAETQMAGREYFVPSDLVLRRAAASECSAYNCEFVVLAEQLGVPLATRDRRILTAFPAIAMEPRALL